MKPRPAHRWRSSRLAALVLLLASGLVALVSGVSSPATAPVGAKVAISGGGSWGPAKEMTAWQNALFGATDAPKVDLGYVAHGTVLGRQDFLAGTGSGSDFVISALGFSDAELKAANVSAADIIDAPISVSSIAFILAAPRGGFEWVHYRCDPDNPDEPDPESCTVKTQYNDPSKPFDDASNPPVKIPNRNLAAMTFSASLTDPPGKNTTLTMWRHPDVLGLFTNLPPNTQSGLPEPFFSFSPNASPTPVNRSDGDEINYYLQQFAKTVAPNDVWKAVVKGADPTADPATFAITERVPHVAGVVTRDGAEQQVAQLGLNGADPTTGGLNPLVQGVFAPAPAAWKADVQEKFGASGQQKFEFIYVKNASGEWIAPTSDTINAAIIAGGDTPLYALTNKAPGGYPFTWVEHIYLHAKGLSLEKTEGLAAAVRYLATAGQDEATKLGEGRLSPGLVAKALAAADKFVQSNCTGADQEVVKSTDPGPYAPDLPALKSIGEMLHCQVKAPVTTTAAPATTAATATTASSPTTAPGRLTTTPLPSSNSLSSSETALPLPTITQPPGSDASSATQTAAPAATATTSSSKYDGALTLAAASSPTSPASNRGATLATLLLGAALFLMVRPVLLGAFRRGGR